LEGTVEFAPSNSSGLIGTLQKFSFPRVVYHQLSGGLLNLLMPARNPNNAVAAKASEEVLPNAEVYDALFGYIRGALGDEPAKLIIMYHPTGVLQQDGSVEFQNDEAALALFDSKCREYGFSFVDMTEPFEDMYASAHKLPHGFVTGKIGSGHINADGHAKIAEELAKRIAALEEAA